jgi:N-acetylglucosaminyl-diphospho-decaprenol L-rhamnosyltransferase
VVSRVSDPEQQPDVTVVVVSYNAIEWLTACLGAIAPAAPTRRVQVVVVDNASTPEVQQYLATRPYGVEVLQQESNLGFGRACNLGAAHGRGRYVLLLNPDAVLHPGAIEALVDFLEADPGRGLVGGRTLRPDGGLDPSSCWGAPTLWSWFCAATGLSSVFRYSPLFDPESLGRWQRDSEREVDIVTGCLLLASRTTWDQLGGFDEDFFMYGEDADLCLRASAGGLRPSITPAATAVHAVGASSPHRLGKQRLLLRGKATLVRKHWSTPRSKVGLALLCLGVGLRATAEAVRRIEDRTHRTLWAERHDWLAGWPPHHP